MGGRVRFGESLKEAIERHILETVSGLSWDGSTVDPSGPVVEQYFPWMTETFSFDPRRHAIALSYLLKLQFQSKESQIEPTPLGEAHAVVWRFESELARNEIGFRQWLVIEKLLGRTLRG
ncbi:MAG: DUF4916 domain-containing protein [Actinomycetota bacterium]